MPLSCAHAPSRSGIRTRGCFTLMVWTGWSASPAGHGGLLRSDVLPFGSCLFFALFAALGTLWACLGGVACKSTSRGSRVPRRWRLLSGRVPGVGPSHRGGGGCWLRLVDQRADTGTHDSAPGGVCLAIQTLPAVLGLGPRHVRFCSGHTVFGRLGKSVCSFAGPAEVKLQGSQTALVRVANYSQRKLRPLAASLK